MLALVLIAALPATATTAPQVATSKRVAACLAKRSQAEILGGAGRKVVSADFSDGNGVRLFYYAKASWASDDLPQAKIMAAQSHQTVSVFGRVLIDWYHKPTSRESKFVLRCLAA